MHSVQFHEFLFCFTFAWPLAALVSALLLPPSRRPRQVLGAVLGGPLWTLVLLWRHGAARLGQGAPASEHELPAPPSGGWLRAVGWALAAGCAYLLGTGVVIFLHPGWTAPYFSLLKAHSAVGYVTWLLFGVFLWRHTLQQSASRRSATLVGLLILAVTVLVHTLNSLSPLKVYASNVPILLCAGLLYSTAGQRTTGEIVT